MCCKNLWLRARFGRVLLSFAVVCIVGCGGSDRVSVAGRVTRTDGSPVIGARVVFRSPETGKSANGLTNSDGHYELGAIKKGDGIPSGEYYVLVSEDRGNWDSPKPRTISAKYGSPKTSDLKFTVEPGKSATYDLVLETK